MQIRTKLNNFTALKKGGIFTVSYTHLDKFPEYYAAMIKYQREGKNAHDDAPDATTGVAETMYKLGG